MKDALSLKASLQIKAAEYWLKLGEADHCFVWGGSFDQVPGPKMGAAWGI
jgi:hypothetical protein